MAMAASTKTFELRLPDGAVLSGSESGVGAALLLVSGLGGSAAFWQQIRQGLPGFRCIAFDQRGIGASTRGSASVSVRQLAQDCLAVLDGLGVAQAHMVGHSTGGCILQELAFLAPDKPLSLVLGGTWAGPDAYMTALFHLRNEILQRSPACYERLGVLLSYAPEWLRQHPEKLLAGSAGVWSEQKVTIVRERISALLAHDRRKDLPQLRQPCLVLGANDDQVVPAHLQRDLAGLLPDSRLVMLADGGHFFPVSRQQQYLAQLQEWLKGRKA